jgi:hypothetical protein
VQFSDYVCDKSWNCYCKLHLHIYFAIVFNVDPLQLVVIDTVSDFQVELFTGYNGVSLCSSLRE